MLIETIFLDLNNVGENYSAFDKLLPKVFANVSKDILHYLKIENREIEFENLIRDYQLITTNNPFHHYPSFWQHITERIINRNLSFPEIETIYDFYLSEYEKNIQIFDDYIPLINLAIKQELKLGLIANGNAKRIYRFLSKYDLENKFSTIIPSGANPFKKPDKEIFRLGLLNLSAKPIHSVFIGDRKDTDIRGANSTGVWSIHLQRPETKETTFQEDVFVPDFTVPNLNEIWNLPLFKISNTIDSIVIPCGGKGTRMEELTEQNQKCLLEIGEQPLLLRVVNKLKASGITNFYFITKHKEELVQEFFGNGSKYGIKAHYLPNSFNSTGAGILSHFEKLPEKFFYSHGNIILSNYALAKIVKTAHLKQEDSIFLITKKPVAKTHPVFNYENNELVGITRKKPENNNGHLSFYSIGFSYLNKNDIHKMRAEDLEEDTTTEQLFKQLNKIKTIEFDSPWLHLETKDDYENFKHLINDEQFQ